MPARLCWCWSRTLREWPRWNLVQAAHRGKTGVTMPPVFEVGEEISTHADGLFRSLVNRSAAIHVRNVDQLYVYSLIRRWVNVGVLAATMAVLGSCPAWYSVVPASWKSLLKSRSSQRLTNRLRVSGRFDDWVKGTTGGAR